MVEVPHTYCGEDSAFGEGMPWGASLRRWVPLSGLCPWSCCPWSAAVTPTPTPTLSTVLAPTACAWGDQTWTAYLGICTTGPRACGWAFEEKPEIRFPYENGNCWFHFVEYLSILNKACLQVSLEYWPLACNISPTKLNKVIIKKKYYNFNREPSLGLCDDPEGWDGGGERLKMEETDV